MLAVIFVILAVRGCFIAMNETGQEPDIPPGTDFVIKVFDHNAKRALTMPLEEYIVGVTAAEMPVSFELEALKAQAVAARTFAVRRIKDLGGTPCGKSGCDICTDSSCCQAWDSQAQMEKHWGSRYEKNRQKIVTAVFGTKGLIATYAGEPIEAMYHSTSGGRTEDSENVYSSALPYLRSVESPGEENAPYFAGEEKYTRKEFAKLVNKAFPKADLKADDLESRVKILTRFDSGRVAQLKLGNDTVTGREFRSALELQSANFKIEIGSRNVIVKTIGFGHGVGLSQLGANAMAKKGDSFDEILCHYYTGIRLEKLIPD
ncbi:MAG: Amidase enhancer precursor [Firmicutes bacterium ADurb.Bin182]|nr:MAG: Amidase enhancer precursor [Firmicutes bacterium ADurb.Bin182]